jgi:hypothetical protein
VTGARHRYRVGEQVEFHPPPILEKKIGGSYSVERLLPLSDTGEVRTYQIKSLRTTISGFQRNMTALSSAPLGHQACQPLARTLPRPRAALLASVTSLPEVGHFAKSLGRARSSAAVYFAMLQLYGELLRFGSPIADT